MIKNYFGSSWPEVLRLFFLVCLRLRLQIPKHAMSRQKRHPRHGVLGGGFRGASYPRRGRSCIILSSGLSVKLYILIILIRCFVALRQRRRKTRSLKQFQTIPPTADRPPARRHIRRRRNHNHHPHPHIRPGYYQRFSSADRF